MQWDENIFEKLSKLLMVFVSVLGDLGFFCSFVAPGIVVKKKGSPLPPKYPMAMPLSGINAMRP